MKASRKKWGIFISPSKSSFLANVPASSTEVLANARRLLFDCEVTDGFHVHEGVATGSMAVVLAWALEGRHSIGVGMFLDQRYRRRAPMNELVKLSAARRAVAEARSVDELKNIRNQAEAIRYAAIQAGMGLEIINDAAEIKLRAERKAGGLLAEMEGHGKRGGNRKSSTIVVLEDLGVTKGESSRWQAIAAVPQEAFDEQIENIKTAGERLTTAGMVRLARNDPELARQVIETAKELKADRLNSTVTYHNQPAIHATRGAIPLAGTSHVYTVEKLLWPEAVEETIAGLLLGRSLHVCCGKSRLGDMRLDLHEPSADIRADAAAMPLPDKSFDTVLCDPPYNGEYQWNHDMLSELARLARARIVFQHWFIPSDAEGRYHKAHSFLLSQIYVWQPRTYFGRAQLISIFEVSNGLA